MSNPANSGVLIGRVGKGGIKEFKNSDGSVALLFDLGIDENFLRTGQTQPETDFVPVRAFIPASANGRGSWTRVGEGDKIAINFRLIRKPYPGKDGKTVYPEVTVQVEGYPQFLEPKSVTEKRAAEKAAKAQPKDAAPVDDKDAEIARLQAALAAQQAGAPVAEAADASESPFGN